MFVKPAPDPERPGEVLIVRDPLHMTPIPATGRNVPEINYWHRLVGHGDLVLAEPPADAPPPAISIDPSELIESVNASIAPEPAPEGT